jgi:rhodanese-related sulfurtransferase
MRAAVLSLVLVMSSAACAGDLTWQSITREITEKFPEAKTITVSELRAKLKNKEPVVLIDVREEKEFAVSRLQGAVHITRVTEVVRRYRSYPGTVVVYCSVGYRSGAMVEQLTEAGMKRVFNLKGSIFEWANRGYPVVNQRGMTPYVHPYDRHWGQLLNKKYHPPE